MSSSVIRYTRYPPAAGAPAEAEAGSLRYPHEGPQPLQERLTAGQGPFQVRNLQDQGRPPFLPHRVHFSTDLPGHPLGDQHQPHSGISPALGQQLPGLGGIVRRPPGNSGQGEGQQGAAIGDDKKPLVFDGGILEAEASCQ
jgi:hypothetical protein